MTPTPPRKSAETKSQPSGSKAASKKPAAEAKPETPALQQRRPLIALLTDFGTEGWYVGVMKGVIKGICPDADIVDISHDVVPQGVIEGALMLSAAYAWFPPETIFLAVVDPGVGSARDPVLLRAHGRWFIGPNNGLLGYVAQRDPDARCRILCEKKFHLPHGSSTFHGRDVFAPAAAHLAAGVDPDALAPRSVDCFGLAASTAWYDRGAVGGDIIYFDHFGNAVTNIPEELFRKHFPGPDTHDSINVHVADRVFTGLQRTYNDVKPGEALAYFGSMGNLEIAVNHCNAREILGLRLLDKVLLRKPSRP